MSDQPDTPQTVGGRAYLVPERPILDSALFVAEPIDFPCGICGVLYYAPGAFIVLRRKVAKNDHEEKAKHSSCTPK